MKICTIKEDEYEFDIKINRTLKELEENHEIVKIYITHHCLDHTRDMYVATIIYKENN